jgi:uncharacterized protein DUF4440
MRILLAFLLSAGLGRAADAPSPAPSKPAPPIHLHAGAPPASPELIAALAQQDRVLFEAVFGCKLEILAAMLTDDFEFFHDKWGQTASSRQQFVDAIAQGCERQRTGSDFKARRELVEGSMTVHVINRYGAMQMGTHRFFALVAGQPDRLTETGRFIDLWKQDNGTWRLARVISYDHRLAE